MSSFISAKTFQTYSYAHFSLFSHLTKDGLQFTLDDDDDDDNNGSDFLNSSKADVSDQPASCTKETAGNSIVPVQNCRPEEVRVSSLTCKEHKDYLMLRNKFPHSDAISSLPFDSKTTYIKRLHKKVQQEQRLFVKAVEESLVVRPSVFYLHDDISKYMQEMLLCHWRRVLEYPRYYTIKDLIPLISTYKGCVIFQHMHTVLQLGTIPYMEMPLLEKKITVSRSYAGTNLKYPANNEKQEKGKGDVLFKMPVSKDSNARTLAAKYGANVVISSGSLKTLFANNEQCLEHLWELPVIVEEHNRGSSTKERVVYIDKPFKRDQLSVFEKNFLYHKRALKLRILQPKHSKAIKLPGHDDANRHNLKLVPPASDLVVQCSVPVENCGVYRTVTDSLSNAELPMHEKSKQYSKPGSAEGDLDDCFSCSCDSEEDRLLIDSSFECSSANPSTELEGNTCKISEGDCGVSCDLDCPKALEAVIPLLSVNKNYDDLHEEGNIRDMNLSMMHQQVEVMDTDSAAYKTSSTSDGQQQPQPLDNDAGVDKSEKVSSLHFRSTLEAIEELQAKTFSSVKSADASKLKEKTNIVMEEPKNFIPPLEGKNICYQLWRIGKLTVLVRCSIDGNNWNIKKDLMPKFWCIEPQMEYMIKYNMAQSLTYLDYARQWIATAVIPEMRLARVRINACNSHVVGLEALSLDEIAPPKSGFRPQDCLHTLATILEKVYLLPAGNYVLSHMAGEGTCKVLREIHESERANYKSVHDLHQSYLKIGCPRVQSNVSEPLPIPALDLDLILFTNKRFSRIPATFKPKSPATGSVSTKTGKKKKKKKKPQQKQLMDTAAKVVNP